MCELRRIHYNWKEHEQAVEWLTKAAEAGLPTATFNLACCLDEGEGLAAPDHPAAAGWYRRAADAGSGGAAGSYTRSLQSST
jgi:TPR repeat protein